MQKQSFDQSYKNYWSFVDHNQAFPNQGSTLSGGYSSSNNSFKGTNLNNMSKNSFVKTGNNLSSNTQLTETGNQGSTLSYQEARRRADELLRSHK